MVKIEPREDIKVNFEFEIVIEPEFEIMNIHQIQTVYFVLLKLSAHDFTHLN